MSDIVDVLRQTLDYIEQRIANPTVSLPETFYVVGKPVVEALERGEISERDIPLYAMSVGQTWAPFSQSDNEKTALEMMEQAVAELTGLWPVVWYADTPYQEDGFACKIPATEAAPEYYIFNDRQFREEIVPGGYQVRWRHIREYPVDYRRMVTAVDKTNRIDNNRP